MRYTYKTKSVQERLWLINMANDRGLIPEVNMNEIVKGIETEEDWVEYPHIVLYASSGRIDLRSIPCVEINLERLFELSNMYPKSGLITKHIKKHVL